MSQMTLMWTHLKARKILVSPIVIQQASLQIIYHEFWSVPKSNYTSLTMWTGISEHNVNIQIRLSYSLYIHGWVNAVKSSAGFKNIKLPEKAMTTQDTTKLCILWREYSFANIISSKHIGPRYNNTYILLFFLIWLQKNYDLWWVV